jgi:hypothetical protein
LKLYLATLEQTVGYLEEANFPLFPNFQNVIINFSQMHTHNGYYHESREEKNILIRTPLLS